MVNWNCWSVYIIPCWSLYTCMLGKWCKYRYDPQFTFGGSDYHIYSPIEWPLGFTSTVQAKYSNTAHSCLCSNSLPLINPHLVLLMQKQIPDPNTDNVSNSSFSPCNGKPIPSCLHFISKFYEVMSWINYIFCLQYQMWTVLSHAMKTSILMKLLGTADPTVEGGKDTLPLSSLFRMPWFLSQLLVAL